MTEVSRRSFLGVAGAGVAGAAVPCPVPRRDRAAPAVPFELGVATYSLRELSRADAIAAVKALRTTAISVKSMHLPYDLDADEMAAARREFADAGLRIVSAGNNTINRDDDDYVRRFFEYARRRGSRLWSSLPPGRNCRESSAS